ncbi:MAG: hypothetical protein WAN59_09665 [Candidatus Baltobacteraceae bacterium]
MNVQLLLALLVPAAVAFGAIALVARDQTTRYPAVPTRDERVAQFNELNAQTPTAPGQEPKAALMLLEQSKIAYERVAGDRSALESKATTLVGLAAAATGGSALLTGGKGIVLTPMIDAAAVMGLVSLGCLLFILRFKFNPQPNPASFVLASTVWDEDMQFRMCLSLSEAYSQGLVRLVGDMRRDRISLFVATASLAAATALLIGNYAVAAAPPTAKTTCSMQYEGTKITKVECTQ